VGSLLHHTLSPQPAHKESTCSSKRLWPRHFRPCLPQGSTHSTVQRRCSDHRCCQVLQQHQTASLRHPTSRRQTHVQVLQVEIRKSWLATQCAVYLYARYICMYSCWIEQYEAWSGETYGYNTKLQVEGGLYVHLLDRAIYLYASQIRAS